MKTSLPLFLLIASTALAQDATISIDAAYVENHVSPRMYAAFVEMMAEDVKRGITAEMLKDRSFDGAPDYLGLPAGWQLEPDERNDNVGAIRFWHTAEVAYPTTSMIDKAPGHSLRICLVLAVGCAAALRSSVRERRGAGPQAALRDQSR